MKWSRSATRLIAAVSVIGGIIGLFLNGPFLDEIRLNILRTTKYFYNSDYTIDGKTLLIICSTYALCLAGFCFLWFRYQKRTAALDVAIKKLTGQDLSPAHLEMLFNMSTNNGLMLFDPFPSPKTFILQQLISWGYAYTPVHPTFAQKTILTDKGYMVLYAHEVAKSAKL
ncbi:hypothetical protein [Pseudomonas sp. Irchel 3H7]|uniref:hypothetical protein n=1 Tax=Pseudomonas sp. Irchel 3H7 TaxID=2009042 RepID=UPI000BA4BD69|nr:hypothetical protein [Pseudomonas sp. Irchel 3H7]